MVVGPSEDNGISPTVWGSDGENSDAIFQNYDIPEYMDRAEEFQSKDSETDPVGRMVVAMQGTRVFRWAAITLPKALSSVIERSGVALEDIEVFVPHQADARINTAFIAACVNVAGRQEASTLVRPLRREPRPAWRARLRANRASRTGVR
ncbi:3-oxoacyl-[acyl-carrier-protein (ACP)] synthase III-like protein [Williamsia muralis]|nr:3-oxoacyl-[acyl-carrier-protein (ACP)] synthase III-like protein [Williamsia marianensis]